jgi:fibronectin type III domain protein/putative metal-binding protein
MKKILRMWASRVAVVLMTATVFAGCSGGGGGGTATMAPNAPSALAAVAASSAGISLTWTDGSDNEDGFRIERSANNAAFSEIGTTAANTAVFSDTGLTASTRYYYRVCAKNSAGDSVYSNIADATTQAPAATAPAAPSSLSATAVSSTAINLAWTDAANNEEGFRIERSASASSGFAEIAIVAANVVAFSDTSLTPSATYYYKVKAYNSAGDSAYTNTANAVTQAPPVTAPAAPTNLVVSSSTSTQIDLSWMDNSSDETGFAIEKSTDGATFIQLATVAVNVAAYSDTGLTPATTYYYKVRAHNSAGNSHYSNIASAASKDTRFCYSGSFGTSGIGVCRAGVQTIKSSVWGPCIGEVTPSAEACNGLDDDCDGAADNNLGQFTAGLGACITTVPACSNGIVGLSVPLLPAASDATCNGIDDNCNGTVDEDCNSCVRVSLTGNDLAADGSAASPFRSIQTAVNWAGSHPGGPQTVCVAAGTTCGAAGTYAGDLSMLNGISVYGNYETTAWKVCGNSTTILQPAAAGGVTFPAAVTSLTILSGFRIDRAAAATTAAITVDGAQNVLLSSLQIVNTPTVTNSYGINVINGGDALLSKSRVVAGSGSSQSVGVRVVGSRITARDNCASLDANGRCDDPYTGSNPAIVGRTTTGTGESYAVLLQDAPNSIIEQSSLGANFADTGAGIRIVGNSAGIQIRANTISASGGMLDSHGIWMEDCGGASPRIVSNALISATGAASTTRVDGIRSIGDCHPVIDSNVHIAGSDGGNSESTAVHCDANTGGVGSKCIVIGNGSIEGSHTGTPPVSVGVRCGDDSCKRIAGNVISGKGGADAVGLWLGKAGTMVERNIITGGCGTASTTGVYAKDSFARLENNLIFGGTCSGTPSPVYRGLHVIAVDGRNEVDVHSNDISGAGNAAACISVGLDLDAGVPVPATSAGIYRNNIVLGGDCPSAYVVRESATSSDPRIFQSNNLDPRSVPTVLYRDEGNTDIGMISGVNALMDMTAGGNISADSLFVAYPNNLHLSTASPCIGSGTATQMPKTDFDNQVREPIAPDMGAYKR